MTERADEPVRLLHDEATGDHLLVYASARGPQIEIRFQGEMLWMTQAQIAQLFGRDQSVISRHINNILDEGELEAESNMQKMHIAGAAKPVSLHSLDMVISVGYRISSAQATLFRRWATGVLVQYARRGFVVDANRLKQGEERDRLAELREIIRDLRSEEANLYRELRRICSLCQDYDPNAEAAREFFQRTQAKLVYAVASQTPSEIIHSRADHAVENMGLQTWSGDEVKKSDAVIAKNFLLPQEVRELNRLTTILLDIFEDQLDVGRLLVMDDARQLLDKQLQQLGRSVLKSGGSISAAEARAKAEAGYARYKDSRAIARRKEADENIAALAREAKGLGRSRGKP